MIRGVPLNQPAVHVRGPVPLVSPAGADAQQDTSRPGGDHHVHGRLYSRSRKRGAAGDHAGPV